MAVSENGLGGRITLCCELGPDPKFSVVQLVGGGLAHIGIIL